VLVAWALDRLARSLRQLLTTAEECKPLGVDLVFLRQNLGTTFASRSAKSGCGQADFFCSESNAITFPYCPSGIHLVAFFRKLLGT